MLLLMCRRRCTVTWSKTGSARALLDSIPVFGPACDSHQSCWPTEWSSRARDWHRQRLRAKVLHSPQASTAPTRGVSSLEVKDSSASSTLAVACFAHTTLGRNQSVRWWRTPPFLVPIHSTWCFRSTSSNMWRTLRRFWRSRRACIYWVVNSMLWLQTTAPSGKGITAFHGLRMLTADLRICIWSSWVVIPALSTRYSSSRSVAFSRRSFVRPRPRRAALDSRSSERGCARAS